MGELFAWVKRLVKNAKHSHCGLRYFIHAVRRILCNNCRCKIPDTDAAVRIVQIWQIWYIQAMRFKVPGGVLPLGKRKKVLRNIRKTKGPTLVILEMTTYTRLQRRRVPCRVLATVPLRTACIPGIDSRSAASTWRGNRKQRNMFVTPWMQVILN